MKFFCQQICKNYSSSNKILAVLKNVNFSVTEGEFVCIAGPSGCGKTTLLKIIAGLLKPSSGQICFESGQNRGKICSAMVFQEHGLFPWMTVLDNAAFGLEMQGIGKKEAQEQARAFLADMGLADFCHAYPHRLSVGMHQRAAIARAFAANPGMLLMDEPFSALDAQTKLLLREELLRIWREHRKTVIYITHDIEEAILLADRVLVMTGRPGSIRTEIPVKIPRPRSLMEGDYPEVREMKRQIWKMLEYEVRQGLKQFN
ncbi:MAG: ABC transporter ATP-binding protein [Desulfococcaceae bacterium]|jgi:NitT/TauT family transport system ATP-binding protein|nr:ABC transporter ATP-binding protein [Desulfococcaceae bacterium]